MRALPITLGPQIKLLVKVVKLLKDIHHKKTLDDAKKRVSWHPPFLISVHAYV